MLKLPGKYENIDKELLKRTLCYVIDNYYGSDDLYINGIVADDCDPIDLSSPSSINTIRKDDRAIISSDDDKHSITDYLDNSDITFTQALIQYINASGKTDAEIYRQANVGKATFNRIINADRDTARPFHVSKKIAFALAAALHLTVIETENLLSKAGYSLSLSNKQDLIIRYCFEHNIYDVIEINEILDLFNIELIGSYKY